MPTAMITRYYRLRIVSTVAAILLVSYLITHLQIFTKDEGFAFEYGSNRADSLPELEHPKASKAFQHPVTKPTLQEHQFGSNGLLVVNPNGSHPILTLIKQATEDWNKKINRASQTFDELVWEYKRRYHRPPPKGFDLWWDYVQEHKIQLPDEYDQINEDLEPFWGINPVDLQEGILKLGKEDFHYTVGKLENGTIGIVHENLPPDRRKELLTHARGILEVLTPVEDKIPSFRAVFTPWDNPSQVTHWVAKDTALQAAAAGTYVNLKDVPTVQGGWKYACPPTSPAAKSTHPLGTPYPPFDGKTFIHDHKKTMDPCDHPSLLHHHGQFLSHSYGPTPKRYLVPQFALCSTMLHMDIRPAPTYGWNENLNKDSNPDWEDKVEERLLWRGSNTGIAPKVDTRWKDAHRATLVTWMQERNGTAMVLPPMQEEDGPVGSGVPMKKNLINPAMLDIAFSGNPLAIPREFSKTLEIYFEFRRRMSLQEAGKYKYILDVDGNGWSSRFKRLMTSNSVIFKSTIYPEWFTDRIAPWVHYIPVQVDLSDLYDSLVFFRGDLHGQGNHDDLAKTIGLAGRKWSKEFWRKEDLTAYMFRQFLEYARVTNVDREAMTFKG